MPACKNRTFAAALLALACALWATTTAHAEDKKADVLSLGGSVTEIIYAMGEEDRLVARDSTSTHPEAANALPDVGYLRRLSPEGVLSVSPGLIISEEGAGPPEAVAVLEAAGIPFVSVPDSYSAEGIAAKIQAVGAALDVPEKAETLAQEVVAQMSSATAATDQIAEADRKRVLFILSAQGGPVLASGTGTAANAIIQLAGGQNAVEGFEGYKPLTDEAISLAAPDVILMMDRAGDHMLDDDALFAMPAMQTTPAAKDRAVVRMNGLYLLGFGPRTAQAVTELHEKLYGS